MPPHHRHRPRSRRQPGGAPAVFTEHSVALLLRDVLRVLLQCHARGLLHRDVKPGNFLRASTAPDAPVKAIDLGLAAPFAPGEPRVDLGLEGTPYYLAPEVLRCGRAGAGHGAPAPPDPQTIGLTVLCLPCSQV